MEALNHKNGDYKKYSKCNIYSIFFIFFLQNKKILIPLHPLYDK